METILLEIERALKVRLYYLAIALSLTLPDICAALEASDGKASATGYRAWYDANLAFNYPQLTSFDCYSLRCGVVHQGRFGHPKSQYGRVIFMIPNPQSNIFHKNIINDALNLDAPYFCRDMLLAVRTWYSAAKNQPTVQANLPKLVQFRANGLPPYIVGAPLIA